MSYNGLAVWRAPVHDKPSRRATPRFQIRAADGPESVHVEIGNMLGQVIRWCGFRWYKAALTRARYKPSVCPPLRTSGRE
jgi:hypothetical protein